MALNIDRLRNAESISAIVLYCHSTHLHASPCRHSGNFRGLRFWNQFATLQSEFWHECFLLASNFLTKHSLKFSSLYFVGPTKSCQISHQLSRKITQRKKNHRRASAVKRRRPTRKTTHPNKTVCTNSLRKLFLPVFCLFKGEREGSLYKLALNCLCKLCFYLGGWVFWVGLPFMMQECRESKKDEEATRTF